MRSFRRLSRLQQSFQTSLNGIGVLAILSVVCCTPAAPKTNAPIEQPAPDSTWSTFITQENFLEWKQVGKAKFQFENGTLTGTARNMQRNSFLASPRTYGDFELMAEVKINPGGNSGIQIRSHLDLEGERVFGYQIEIDTTERAWSGGLYDEGRRGWLNSLKDKPEARAAFQNGEWNLYQIRCQGDHFQSWVNGVPCADFHDDVDASGYIAFQVHGGKFANVSWRNVRIREL